MKREKILREIRSWLGAIAFILILRGFVVQTFHVPSGSMKDTILIGDFLIVNRLAYGVKLPFTDRYLLRYNYPQRDEIIVFRFPVEKRTLFTNTNFVKRCIALEGDTVEIKHKKLYVNGELKENEYISHRGDREYPPLDISEKKFINLWEDRKLRRYPYVRDNFGPIVVPEDHVFALGDNRDNSDDSRFWGPVPINYISGKPLFIYWSWRPDVPISNFFKKIRWKRIGKVFSS